MTELTLDVCGRFDEKGNFIVDDSRLDEIIGKYKVGSILNAPGNTAQTPEAWKRIIGAIQEKSMSTMGIPCIYGLDQNHGTTYTAGGTFFPQNINVAATFNTELARQAAEITAYETRASSAPWTYSPTLDLGLRAPARTAARYGAKCFSRRSETDTTAGVRSFPLKGTAHAAAALNAAEESMVLLKNADNTLPIPKGKKILVTGPNANSMRCLNGGWSYSWQGNLADRFASGYNTILEAMQQKFGVSNVSYEAGVTYKQDGAYWEENEPEIEKVLSAFFRRTMDSSAAFSAAAACAAEANSG